MIGFIINTVIFAVMWFAVISLWLAYKGMRKLYEAAKDERDNYIAVILNKRNYETSLLYDNKRLTGDNRQALERIQTLENLLRERDNMTQDL